MNIFKKIKIISKLVSKINAIEKLVKKNKDLADELHKIFDELSAKIPDPKEIVSEVKEILK